MNKFTAVSALGALGAIGSYHIYRGSYQQDSNGFLQWVEEDITEMPAFLEWMNQHGKSYETTAEFENRFKIFKANSKAIADFDIARHALKNIGEEITEHSLELNKFADWSEQEYRAMLAFRPALDKE